MGEHSKSDFGGHRVPEEYSAVVSHGIGYFRPDPDPDGALLAWFGQETQLANALVPFMFGPSGDIYAYWVYEGRSIRDAPIVHIGHEASDLTVIASSLHEFLSLVALNRDEIYPGWMQEEDWDDADPLSPEDTELLQGLGVRPAKDPEEVMRRAISAHPDFEEWLQFGLFVEQFRGHELPNVFADVNLYPHGEYSEGYLKLTDAFWVHTSGLELAAEVSGADSALCDRLYPIIACGDPVTPYLDSSLYGYWRYGDRSLAESPIVYIPAPKWDFIKDWERRRPAKSPVVLCSSMEELFSLIALGYEEVHPDYFRQPPPIPTEDVLAFRSMIAKNFRIKPADDPLGIVKRAQANHPSFADALGSTQSGSA